MKISKQIIDSEEIISNVLSKVFPDDPIWDIETYDEYCTIIEQTLLCLKQEDEEMNLPTEAVVEISELDCCLNDEAEIKEAVIDFLTEEFGFCIKGCAISLKDEGLAKVTNIDWDTEE